MNTVAANTPDHITFGCLAPLNANAGAASHGFPIHFAGRHSASIRLGRFVGGGGKGRLPYRLLCWVCPIPPTSLLKHTASPLRGICHNVRGIINTVDPNTTR